MSITSNAPGAPATINLAGTGIQPLVSPNPASASFGNVLMGNSNPRSITLRNTGNATLTFSQITVNGAGYRLNELSTTAAGGNISFNAVFSCQARRRASTVPL